jgi:glycosyltransferase involved in cell wall biosynthesis
MNRFEILEIFLKKFGDRMTTLRDGPSDWNPCEIAVSIDGRGGDRQGKSFLPQEHYFAALRDCDFVLSPPGWCMPVSHNLVEAMFCGGIPITNAEAFMAPPLENGKNCLEFSVETELVAALEKALAISEQEIEKMRGAIWNYNDRFLNPKAFGEMLGKIGSDRLLVNAEENSVPLGRGL